VIQGVLKGCGTKCVEEFEYLMALTGWSQNTLMMVFFTVIFILLIGLAMLGHKFRKKRRSRRWK
jgi:uncharacterized membrane protein YciS (DUF1049 family)